MSSSELLAAADRWVLLGYKVTLRQGRVYVYKKRGRLYRNYSQEEFLELTRRKDDVA